MTQSRTNPLPKRNGRKLQAAGQDTLLDAQRLMHELEVHQVELELQNYELRTTRSELEQGLQRYRELFDFAPIGYVTLGPRLELVELNHAAAELLGRDRAQLPGVAFSRLLAAADLQRFDVAMHRADKTRTQQQVELRLDNHRLVCVTIAVLDGMRMLLALQDISERRANEDRLAHTEGALRLANQRKDEFLALLSHELRNPLAPIRNCIFLLSEQARKHRGLPADAEHALAIMERQVAHLTRMIDDLLDVTRIGRGKVQLRREVLDLSVLVERALDDQRASFEAAGIALEHIPGPPGLWVDADPARITQILSNVLGNAEKFTSRGGRVDVSLAYVDRHAVLRVRDSGAGIPADVLPTVFEPFAQAPQTMDRSRGGLGLGLSMVKGLVELHEGTVRIASAGRGLGTEITIELPTSAASMASAADVSGDETTMPRRVLVIDDNEDAADTLCHALSSVGHDVHVAYDGSDALAQARTFRPEIVLCDIGLPGMDGYQVARCFRADAALSGAFLVALTGYARPEDQRHALEAGFDEHVAKPPSIARLCRILTDGPPQRAAQ